MSKYIQIAKEIDVATAIAVVSKPQYGALNIFVGKVRDHTQGKHVEKLFFECYEPMAILEMERIMKQAKENYDIQEIAIYHAIGEKLPGEDVVIIAVAAFHRKAAFSACQFAIDTLKESVPIWKKEFFSDGSVWVAAHP